MADGSNSTDLTCAACGYNLTGAVVGRNCPECGSELQWHVADDAATTRRQAVAVLLRLGAVTIVILSLSLLDLLIWSVFALVLDEGSYGGPDWLLLLGQATPLVVHLGIAVLLWGIAPRLARVLVARDGLLLHAKGFGPQQMLSVGLILLGLYAFIRGAAYLIDGFLSTWPILSSINASAFGVEYGVSLYTSLVWTVSGLLLMSWPRLRAWLGRDLSEA